MHILGETRYSVARAKEVRRHVNANLSGDDVCQRKYSSSDILSLSPVGKPRNYVNGNPCFSVFGAVRQPKT